MAGFARTIMTKLGFQVDNGKLRAVNSGIARTKKQARLASREVWKLKRQVQGLAVTGAKWLAVGYGITRLSRVFTTSYAKEADELAKFSKATGVSVGMLQGLEHGTKLAGGSVNDLRKTLTKLGKAAFEADQGLMTYKRAFADIGVDVRDGNNELKDQDQLLLELADKFKGMKDGTRKTALSMQIFGRAGARMIPLLNEGAAGIEKMRKEAADLGIILTKKAAKDAEQFNDEMLRAKSVFKGIRNQIAAKLLPAITKAMRGFQLWARESGNMQRLMRGLKIAAIATAAALALIGAAKVTGAIGQVAAVVVRATSAIRAMGMASLIAQGKMLLIALALLAVAAIVEDLIGFAQGKDSVIGRLLGDSETADDLRKSLKGFGKEVMGIWKDLKPAMMEVWAAMKPALKDLWAAIKPLIPWALKLWVLWVKVQAKLLTVIAMIVRFVAKIVRFVIKFIGLVVKGVKGLVSIVKGIAGTIKKAFKPVFGFISSGISGLISGAVKLIGKLKEAMGLGGDTSIHEEIKRVGGAAGKKLIKTATGAAAEAEPPIPFRKRIVPIVQRVGTMPQTTHNRVSVGAVNVTVRGSTGMGKEEVAAAVREGTQKALQEQVTNSFRNRAPVVP